MNMLTSVFPKNYKLTFEPDFHSFTFKGHELISLQIGSEVNSIQLHSLNLKVFHCYLSEGSYKQELQFEIDKKGYLSINLNNKISQKEIQIEIEFEGDLNDKLAGFYRSKYEENGKEKYLATTQFEAADARQAFPCFDEPAFKATFDITLVVDKELLAISNMPVNFEEMLSNGKRSVTFETTPIMSTYLVYLGVGDFELIEKKYKNILIRGITTKGKSEFTVFAMDCAIKSLEYFEEYFNAPYPLPKLDLIAIPDFASGAMENWGAITFRENAILFYPGKSSVATTQRVAEVVCHELAHQWFGNLVTMKWWDDLWLNESFATYMSYKVMDKYWPEWDMWTQYINATVFEGMSLDCLRSSHPIKVKVTSIEEMNELFDEIAYEKGGSVLRMIERYMGDEAFKKGLQKYIAENMYKNTEAQDLWKALESIDDKNILPLVDKYLNQVGFPYLSVDVQNDNVTISQKRFVYGEEDSSQWYVPILFKTIKKEVIPDALIKQKQSFGALKGSIISVNADYGSFAISQYSEDVLKKMSSNSSLLNEKEKIGLIHDLYYLSRFQKQSINIFIDFINESFTTETNSAVLLYLVEVLDQIYSMSEVDRIKQLLFQYSRSSLELIGLEPTIKDSTFDTYLRSFTLSSLSELEDKKTVNFLNTKFEEFLRDNDSLHPDLRGIVYANAVRTNEKNYDKVMELYKKSSVQEEKVKFLSALAKTENKALVKKTLDFCLTPDVRFANAFYALHSASDNPRGKKIALDWMIEKWDEFGKRVGGHGGTLLRRFVKIVIPECGIGEEEKVKKFIENNKVAGLEKSFDQVWEELQINSAFVNKIKEYL
jgi:tricorn protease interacting factor F2/3